MRALKVIKIFLQNGLADSMSLKLLEFSNGQPSVNNSTRLIEKDAQREEKKLCNESRNDTTDICYFKKLCFQKNYKGVFN